MEPTTTTTGLEELRVICADLEARPLFWTGEGRQRHGFEPEVAALIGDELGIPVSWVFTPWSEFMPALNAGKGDVILCGQGISDYRKRFVDFTTPYAIFDESVLVRADSAIRGPADLAGVRVAAIANSVNMALAETFEGAVRVPFDGASDDVFGDMIAALRAGEVDAVVDDDVALVPIGDDPDFRVAFTVPTRNEWGVSVAKGREDVLQQVDTTLARVRADGRLERVWRRWLPDLAYPFRQPEGA